MTLEELANHIAAGLKAQAERVRAEALDRAISALESRAKFAEVIGRYETAEILREDAVPTVLLALSPPLSALGKEEE